MSRPPFESREIQFPLSATANESISGNWSFTGNPAITIDNDDSDTGISIPAGPTLSIYKVVDQISSGIGGMEFDTNTTIVGNVAFTGPSSQQLKWALSASAANIQNVSGNLGLTGVGGSVTIGGNKTLRLPTGTTAQRPGTPVNGDLRYNSTLSVLEGFEAGAWRTL